jgi:hypothetical protein
LQREIKSSHKRRTALSADAEEETSDRSSAAGSCSSDCSALEEANELNIAQLPGERIDGSFADAAEKRCEKDIKEIGSIDVISG